jgi:hypothetical protein
MTCQNRPTRSTSAREGEDKKKIKRKGCNFTVFGKRKPWVIAMTFVLLSDVMDIINRAKYDLDRSRGFSRQVREKRLHPLESSIAHTTLPCANALACDYNNRVSCILI